VRTHRTLLAATVAVTALAALAAAAWRGAPGTSPARDDWLAAAAAALPPPAPSGLHVARPASLRGAGSTTWAPVDTSVVARNRPSGGARPVSALSTRTPEGTANLAVVTRGRVVNGRLWVQVSVPALPNGRRGWVPRSALGGYTVVDTRLVISLRSLRATLFRDGKPIFRAPVGVGAPASPTPAGEFYVRDKLTRYASPFYGPVAFGTSARSEVLTDWPAGGFIGIHGTDRPDLIPGRVSHGCIRLRNADILRLSRLLPIGTPVVVRA
jgi:lipoprotein-anchoring transpeptidase ErfK/SrfK